ncbi:hypothetical protein L208DRAFT_1410396, partial [Tricholoma matsutake]
ENDICHLNTKDLVVVVFFVVLSSLHHHCSGLTAVVWGCHGGSFVWSPLSHCCLVPKKVCPIAVPAPVVPCPSSLIVAC